MTHNEWKNFKLAFGLKNKDIADIIGMDVTSVTNQTSPSRGCLPKWAIAFVWSWKKCLENEVVPKVRLRRNTSNALKFF